MSMMAFAPMLRLVFYGCITLVVRIEGVDGSGCMSRNGKPVDNWLWYKIPPLNKGKSDDKLNGLYWDSEFSQGKFEQVVLTYLLTNQNYGNPKLEYNDQIVGSQPKKFHAKGFFYYHDGEDEGFWISHSLPLAVHESGGFDIKKNIKERTRGQHMFCTTIGKGDIEKVESMISKLKGLETSNKVEMVSAKDMKWKYFLSTPSKKNPSDIYKYIFSKLTTTGSKSKMFIQTEHLKSSMLSRGATYVSPYMEIAVSYQYDKDKWKVTNDHSKWAVIGKYVCFGDKNIEYKQIWRYGGGICIENQELADLMIGLRYNYLTVGDQVNKMPKYTPTSNSEQLLAGILEEGISYTKAANDEEWKGHVLKIEGKGVSDDDETVRMEHLNGENLSTTSRVCAPKYESEQEVFFDGTFLPEFTGAYVKVDDNYILNPKPTEEQPECLNGFPDIPKVEEEGLPTITLKEIIRGRNLAVATFMRRAVTIRMEDSKIGDVKQAVINFCHKFGSEVKQHNTRSTHATFGTPIKTFGMGFTVRQSWTPNARVSEFGFKHLIQNDLELSNLYTMAENYDKEICNYCNKGEDGDGHEEAEVNHCNRLWDDLCVESEKGIPTPQSAPRKRKNPPPEKENLFQNRDGRHRGF